MASQDVRYACWYVYESGLGHPLLTTRQRDGQSPKEMAVGSVEKDVGSHTTPSWACVVMRECGLEPLQFNFFRTAMRLYYFLTESNSKTNEKALTTC
jgi:hypothetical protein